MDFFSGKILRIHDDQSFDVALNYQRVGNKQKYGPVERVMLSESNGDPGRLNGQLVGIHVISRNDNIIQGKLRIFSDLQEKQGAKAS